jgi:hypothetical protein
VSTIFGREKFLFRLLMVDFVAAEVAAAAAAAAAEEPAVAFSFTVRWPVVRAGREFFVERAYCCSTPFY